MNIFWKKCNHEKLSVMQKSGYCPDCGDYVENHWYIAHCKCCEIRLKTIIKNSNPTPLKRFCPNCGCEEFYIEEIDTPDIVSINYAGLQRNSHKINAQSLVQTWIENKVQQNYGFLPAYQY